MCRKYLGGYFRLIMVAFLAAASATSSLTWAAGPESDATRAAARSMGQEGVAAYQNGDYTTALDRLSRAYQAFPVPTLGLWYARTLEKLGKWVQASERYAEVMRLEIAESAKKSEQKKAQATAQAEYDALKERIPVIVIKVEGPPPASVEVYVDGNIISSALVGMEFPVDPGTHRVRGKGQWDTASQEMEISEKQKGEVVLRLLAEAPATGAVPLVPPATTAPPVSRTAIPTQPASPAVATSPSQQQAQPPPATPPPMQAARATAEQDAPVGTSQRTWGWLTLGMGGVGLAVAGVTGVMTLSKKSSLDSSNHCVSGTCDSTQHSTLEEYNSLRSTSGVAFVAGTALAATGVLLLLTAPSAKQTPQVSLWLLPTAANLNGSF